MKNSRCQYVVEKNKLAGAQIVDVVKIISGSEQDLTASIAKVGPITIAVDAGMWEFMNYKGGIFDGRSRRGTPLCGNGLPSLNHELNVVGYDTQKGIDFYIVRNSWGVTRWGNIFNVFSNR